MNSYGKLFIIPSEDVISDDLFERNVRTQHLEGLIEFSEIYNLGHKFDEGDYQEACYILANDGHRVVKTIEDSGNLIMFIPPVVTDRQDMWLHNNKDMLSNFHFSGAYFLKGEENKYDTLTGIDSIIRKCDQKNIRYEEGVNKNVR